ncbi:hypothetical protein [Streptomyces iconiensis]|uniref:hypothetical protein n=1 Tax=Streptomyces iconiensis TaxID=1384038 RepID=UPI003219A6BB
MSGLTWQQLDALDLGLLETAADGWGQASGRADASRTRVDNEMVDVLKKSQEGDAERAAVRRLRQLSQNFQYVYMQCGMARTSLNGLAAELRAPQKQLREVLDEARERKFTVKPDGSVEYPAAGKGEGGQPPPGGSSGAAGVPHHDAQGDRQPGRHSR